MDWPMGTEGVDIEAWAESAANIYWWPLLAWVAGVVILLFLAVVITSSPVRRRFWCEQAGREVDVAFEEDGPHRLQPIDACAVPSGLPRSRPLHSGEPALLTERDPS
jgi:hypothetical protein